MLVDGSRVLFSINGNLIDAAVTTRYGDVYIDEGAGQMPASLWIVKRLANLTMLASRLKERIQINKNFVSPAARVLQSLEKNPNEETNISCDALAATIDSLNQRSPLETTVLYLTSDAGEGKTSLINELAHKQATSFLENKSDWLLIPIPLAGRHFLRFDDITVGALQNRYRFPFLYYNSFLALVQMGVIVPAFDGFEEMFVENSSGEALSAMGILVGALDSTGAVLIAARKAYFEFENLKAQEKLYDTISSYSVGFGKLELSRWEKKQFFEYCELRKIASHETIYESVCDRLGSNHALLTRPVLVKRLVDIAEASKSLEIFIDQIQISGADFFSVFVRGIIEREANEKWIDRSGEVGTPLLTVDEHVELLSRVALAMWDARLDYLKRDMLEFESDLYCEIKRKSPFQSQQIRERLRGHALLIASSNTLDAVEFDHDEFKLFFVGEALAEVLKTKGDRAKTEALSALRRGILPEQSLIALLRALKRDDSFDRIAAARRLMEIGLLDGQASYTQENCGILVLRLLSDVDSQGLIVENLAFGADALRGRKLQGIKFCNCHFSQSSLENTSFENCIFDECTFGQLRIFSSTNFTDVSLTNSKVDSLRLDDSGLEIWEPNAILVKLHSLGVNFGIDQDILVDHEDELKLDDELAKLEKLLRYFMRSTHVSESVIKIKLGDRGQGFLDNTVPKLLECKILEQIENRGGASQRRFRLSMPLARVNASIATSGGEFSKFLEIATET